MIIGKTSRGKRLATKGIEKSRKRKAPIEDPIEESGNEEQAYSKKLMEEEKTIIDIAPQSDSDGEGDSDKELQIALREGLLKTDKLNYIVPAKRPIINRTAEMREKVAEFAKKLPWIETVDVTTKSTLTKEMIDNDFDREMQFYLQAEKAVQIAVPRLLSMGVKVIRPSDYYAEMAKSDGHMQKVRKRLLKIQEGKERQEAIRRMREEK
ncbi:hypothetical protein TELCIR_04045 [Teladorsagia circumcincta]|uniref:Uncharacterized protein n=1 Tax=Teladorsagia circumcincta TaxID=45464 RepID=A0A2G9UUL5_TELCI|nr:hypothetical protein TELCIR_04045 [Teladorsagia circumcincta]